MLCVCYVIYVKFCSWYPQRCRKNKYRHVCGVIFACLSLFPSFLIEPVSVLFYLLSLGLSHSCYRFEWQHVWWDAAATGPPFLNPHRQHPHPIHHIHRLRTYFYGRKGRLPLWDSLSGRGRMVEPALQKNQPLQKLSFLPHTLCAPVLFLRGW